MGKNSRRKGLYKKYLPGSKPKEETRTSHEGEEEEVNGGHESPADSNHRTFISQSTFMRNLEASLERLSLNPSEADNDGNTALHYAVWLMRVHAIQDLVNRGADPYYYNNQGISPIGIIENNSRVYGHLAQAFGPKKPEPVTNVYTQNEKAQDPEDLHPLYYAVRGSTSDNMQNVPQLLMLGHNPYQVNPEYDDDDISTPAKLAYQLGLDNVSNAIDVWTICQTAYTIIKIQAPLKAFIFSVLECGDVNAQHHITGDTALHCAVFLQMHEDIDNLLAQGANPYIRNKAGKTAAELAEQMGNEDLSAQIALHMSAQQETKCEKLETSAGAAEATATSKFQGNSNNAQKQDNQHIVHKVLRGKFPPNHKVDNDYNTALLLAIKHDMGQPCVQHLFLLGADPNIKNIRGSTPHQLATFIPKYNGIFPPQQQNTRFTDAELNRRNNIPTKGFAMY